MLSLLANLNPTRYTHRSYILSSGDDFSAQRAWDFEKGLLAPSHHRDSDVKREGNGNGNGNRNENDANQDGEGFSIYTVPRARSIHQSLLSTPLTSLHCLHSCLLLLHNHPHGYPDLILTNGPATALILLLAATMIRFFAFINLPVVGRRGEGPEEKMRTIYVESWARVKRPSLSGRIIVYCGLCNRVLVQWKGLETRGWGEYRGALVR